MLQGAGKDSSRLAMGAGDQRQLLCPSTQASAALERERESSRGKTVKASVTGVAKWLGEGRSRFIRVCGPQILVR